MARPLRIEYAGAIDHVMSRGNARRRIFRDDADRQNLLNGLEDTVVRYGWELFSFIFIPNHIHLFFRTPRPNLSRGMQRLLSTYANRYARRHRHPGHLFQGHDPWCAQASRTGTPARHGITEDQTGKSARPTKKPMQP